MLLSELKNYESLQFMHNFQVTRLIASFKHYLEVRPSYYEIDNTMEVSEINFG